MGLSKNEEITKLSEEILLDITSNRVPLHIVLLKSSRLSLLLDIPKNVELFKDWSKSAEQKNFIIETYNANIDAAKDTSVSVASANPNQYVNTFGNGHERQRLKNEASDFVNLLSYYRAETYNFVVNIYTKSQFGNIAESIFEKKRMKADSNLRKIFPDINQRLNSIEQNIKSDNPEDWKNSVISCRTLLMEIADILNPPKTSEEKSKFINRLKDYISPKIPSETKGKLVKGYFEELKNRIEYTMDVTQGSAHKDRPIKDEAEDIILYTYLLIADLMSVGGDKSPIDSAEIIDKII